MKNVSLKNVSTSLFHIISDMEASSELFVKQPGKDFIRTRNLTFSHTIKFLLSMGGNTV